MAVVRLGSVSMAERMAMGCRSPMGDLLGAFSYVFCQYIERRSTTHIHYPVGLGQ